MQVNFNVVIGLHGNKYNGVTVVSGKYTYCYRINHISYWLRKQGKAQTKITPEIVIQFHNEQY